MAAPFWFSSDDEKTEKKVFLFFGYRNFVFFSISLLMIIYHFEEG